MEGFDADVIAVLVVSDPPQQQQLYEFMPHVFTCSRLYHVNNNRLEGAMIGNRGTTYDILCFDVLHQYVTDTQQQLLYTACTRSPSIQQHDDTFMQVQ